MLHNRNDYNRRIQDTGHSHPDRLASGQLPIPHDEPVFLLRAQDATAAATVEFWADLNEKLGVYADDIAAARRWAAKMRAWQKKKLVDSPKGELRQD